MLCQLLKVVRCNCTHFFGLPSFGRIVSQIQVGGKHKMLQQKCWHDTSSTEKYPLDTVALKGAEQRKMAEDFRLLLKFSFASSLKVTIHSILTTLRSVKTAQSEPQEYNSSKSWPITNIIK